MLKGGSMRYFKVARASQVLMLFLALWGTCGCGAEKHPKATEEVLTDMSADQFEKVLSDKLEEAKTESEAIRELMMMSCMSREKFDQQILAMIPRLLCAAGDKRFAGAFDDMPEEVKDRIATILQEPWWDEPVGKEAAFRRRSKTPRYSMTFNEVVSRVSVFMERYPRTYRSLWNWSEARGLFCPLGGGDTGEQSWGG
jgi:hypothetical protein